MAQGATGGTTWTSPKKTPGGGRGIGNIFTGAVDTQAADYDNIMSAYQSLLNQNQANAASGTGSNAFAPVKFNPITAQQTAYSPTAYSQSAGFGNALSQLNANAQTGGFSEGDISNIRARGISPIRAVYAQAKQNLERQKNLQGGYSPNYGALQAKMARESSALISDKTTDVNAGIAEMLQKSKANALSQYGSLTGNENTLMNNINSQNAAGLNNVNSQNAENIANTDKFNASMQAQLAQLNASNANAQQNNLLAPIQGMQSLYGTTPALANTFGNQVLSSGNQNISANQAVNNQYNTRANLGYNIGIGGSTGRRR